MADDSQIDRLAILSKVSLNQTCARLNDCRALVVYPPLLPEKPWDQLEPQAG